MNPLITAALGSIIRWGLALGAGYLVRAGVWAEADAKTYVFAASMAVLSLGWSLWQKWKANRFDWWHRHIHEADVA